jgi:hypothetical protein
LAERSVRVGVAYILLKAGGMQAMTRYAVAALVALPVPVGAVSVANADVDSTLQAGIATEHGGGLGVAREFFFGDTTLVGGLGLSMALGYSSINGWVGAVAPGAAGGVRHYWGGLYVGPTVGVNYTVWASEMGASRTEGSWSPWPPGASSCRCAAPCQRHRRAA